MCLSATTLFYSIYLLRNIYNSKHRYQLKYDAFNQRARMGIKFSLLVIFLHLFIWLDRFDRTLHLVHDWTMTEVRKEVDSISRTVIHLYFVFIFYQSSVYHLLFPNLFHWLRKSVGQMWITCNTNVRWSSKRSGTRLEWFTAQPIIRLELDAEKTF